MLPASFAVDWQCNIVLSPFIVNRVFVRKWMRRCDGLKRVIWVNVYFKCPYPFLSSGFSVVVKCRTDFSLRSKVEELCKSWCFD